MSVANPRESLDALVGRSVRFAGRDLVLTNAAMIALSVLGLEASTTDSPLFVWALVWGASRPGSEVVDAMRSDNFGKDVVLAFARRHSREQWAEAKDAARKLLALMNGSVCDFRAKTEAKPSAIGGWVSTVALFLKEFGISVDEFFAMPATRANALYGALCEQCGMHPVNTFCTREKAPLIDDFLRNANFGEKPAKVRVVSR